MCLKYFLPSLKVTMLKNFARVQTLRNTWVTSITSGRQEKICYPSKNILDSKDKNKSLRKIHSMHSILWISYILKRIYIGWPTNAKNLILTITNISWRSWIYIDLISGIRWRKTPKKGSSSITTALLTLASPPRPYRNLNSWILTKKAFIWLLLDY